MKQKWINYILLIGFIGVMACSRNPVTGKKQVVLMSENQEIALGAQSDPGVVSNFGLYPDEKLQKFIDTKGQQMAKISHRPELKYEFKILDSPVVNAFALPGGYVYFTRGILAHFNNEAEFAGVLGHEIGHVTARHGVTQYTNQMLAQLGFIVGLVVSEQFRQFADQASQGMQLLFLKNGRDDESQSDELGVEYSTEIGYDAHEMANFFETINRLQVEAGVEIPTFLSTHPNPLDRYNKVHEMAKAAQAEKSGQQFKINRESYLRMIDGMVYGEDPRQGYVENNRFYHPELKFQFPVPNGWNVNNTPAQVQMAPEGGKALILLRVAQGSSLDEAAQNMVQNNQLQVQQSSKVQVNGLPAIAMVSDQQNSQTGETIRILTYLIQYNKLIYEFDGLSASTDFNTYKRYFDQVFQNFKELTDQSKMLVQPERIGVKTVQQAGTLAEVLRSYNQSSKRFDELAILNGMQIGDRVEAGSLIKVIEE